MGQVVVSMNGHHYTIGCADGEDLEYRPTGESPPGPGIVTGEQGAVIIEDRSAGRKGVVRLGGRVTLKDLSTGRSTACQLVHPDEANPLSGKISSGSPVGGAIIGHSVGERVEVHTPGGIQNLEITRAT